MEMITEIFYRTNLPCGTQMQNRIEQMLWLIWTKRHRIKCDPCQNASNVTARKAVLIDGIEVG